jgi:hypothetical protein
MITETQILKLRTEFTFGGVTMVDWFEINNKLKLI